MSSVPLSPMPPPVPAHERHDNGPSVSTERLEHVNDPFTEVITSGIKKKVRYSPVATTTRTNLNYQVLRKPLPSSYIYKGNSLSIPTIKRTTSNISALHLEPRPLTVAHSASELGKPVSLGREGEIKKSKSEAVLIVKEGETREKSMDPRGGAETRAKNDSQPTLTVSEDAPAELTAAVDELLSSLTSKFSSTSNEIFGKMDEMSRRLDNLEAAIQARGEASSGK
ncbi:MAG: hypothetical protein M1834_003396 [Cirrosporium novae-zelandiae]|nr:MAG: hypothetical protein M1834_003396 [Cirrosporium novae-zelandiae]